MRGHSLVELTEHDDSAADIMVQYIHSLVNICTAAFIGEERSNETGNLIIADGSVEFCEATPIGLVDEPKVSLYGRETDQDLRSACRCVA